MSFINFQAVKRNCNKSKLSNRKATLKIKEVSKYSFEFKPSHLKSFSKNRRFSTKIFQTVEVLKLHGRQRKRLGVVGELAFRLPITEAQ